MSARNRTTPKRFSWLITMFFVSLALLSSLSDYLGAYSISQEVKGNFFGLNPHSITTFHTPFTPPGGISASKASPILGSGPLGEDILAWYLIGLSVSLTFGAVTLMIAMVIGLMLGMIAGEWPQALSRNRGALGGSLQTFIALVDGLPGFIIIGALLTLLPRGFWETSMVVSGVMAVQIARQAMASTTSQLASSYVEAAYLSGAKGLRLWRYHILPGVWDDIRGFVPLLFGAIVAMEAVLTFLGLGLPIGTPSLGALLQMLRQGPGAWWISVTTVGTMTLLSWSLFSLSRGSKRR